MIPERKGTFGSYLGVEVSTSIFIKKAQIEGQVKVDVTLNDEQKGKQI